MGAHGAVQCWRQWGWGWQLTSAISECAGQRVGGPHSTTADCEAHCALGHMLLAECGRKLRKPVSPHSPRSRPNQVPPFLALTAPSFQRPITPLSICKVRLAFYRLNPAIPRLGQACVAAGLSGVKHPVPHLQAAPEGQATLTHVVVSSPSSPFADNPSALYVTSTPH